MRKQPLAMSQVPCSLPDTTLLIYFDPPMAGDGFLVSLTILKNKEGHLKEISHIIHLKQSQWDTESALFCLGYTNYSLVWS